MSSTGSPSLHGIDAMHPSHAHTRVIKGIPHMHILDGLERAFARKRRLRCVQFRSATNEAVSAHGTLLLAVASAPAFEVNDEFCRCAGIRGGVCCAVVESGRRAIETFRAHRVSDVRRQDVQIHRGWVRWWRSWFVFATIRVEVRLEHICMAFNVRTLSVSSRSTHGSLLSPCKGVKPRRSLSSTSRDESVNAVDVLAVLIANTERERLPITPSARSAGPIHARLGSSLATTTVVYRAYRKVILRPFFLCLWGVCVGGART